MTPTSPELDGFYRAAADYVDVLGPVELDEYRRLLEPRWQRLVEPHGAEGSTERVPDS